MIRARGRVLRSLALPVCIGVVALATVTGCQAGNTAPTSQPYNPTDGRNFNVPSGAAFTDDYIAVRNAYVTPIDTNAALTVTLVNNGTETDMLSSATIGDANVNTSGAVALPPNQSVSIGPGTDIGGVAVKAKVNAGDWVTVTLTFANAGPIEFQALAVAPKDTAIDNSA
jgi:copper(I)-binding protein